MANHGLFNNSANWSQSEKQVHAEDEISLHGEDTGEDAALAVFPLGDGEVDITKGAILEKSDDVTASTNDLSLAGSEIALNVLVVMNSVVFRHQHLDVLTNDLGQ